MFVGIICYLCFASFEIRLKFLKHQLKLNQSKWTDDIPFFFLLSAFRLDSLFGNSLAFSINSRPSNNHNRKKRNQLQKVQWSTSKCHTNWPPRSNAHSYISMFIFYFDNGPEAIHCCIKQSKWKSAAQEIVTSQTLVVGVFVCKRASRTTNKSG